MGKERLDFFRSHLEACSLCPRACGVNRLAGEIGVCRAGARLKVASHCVHIGEEPPISGKRGSGTIFFSHCSMACVYCQNYPISQLGHGNYVEIEDLAGMMLSLERRCAHNINLVTATHFLPQIVAAIDLARQRGLRLPIVYNDSGYERPEIIGALEGVVQVYLADMRYATAEAAAKYSGAPDYPAFNRLAIKEMLARVGNLRCRDGAAEGGLIIRHLMLPSLLAETETILEFISSEVSRDATVSLMTQYFPANKAHLYPELNRKITKEEYEAAVALLDRFGLDNGWVQDTESSSPPVA
ncbi:MAG: radical SAM protein [Candidatus Eisenbacteria bacterium]